MRAIIQVVLAFSLFAIGVVVGVTWRGLDPGAPRTETSASETSTAEGETQPDSATPSPAEAAEAFRDLFARLTSAGDDPGDERGGSRPSKDEAFESLRAAMARGDRDGVMRAIHDLEARRDELAPEDLDALAELLRDADADNIHALSRALVQLGGVEGARRVLAFAAEADVPMRVRHEALWSIADLPPAESAKIAPDLVSFLQSAPGADLERTAARVYGRIHGERGVEALLGLLGPGSTVPANAVLDAIGDVARPADASALIDLAARETWTRHERESLLRSTTRLLAREGQSERLLELLGAPPAGVSRQAIARALADVADSLGTGVLEAALHESAGDPRAQEELARALARRGSAEDLRALLDAAADPDVALDRRALARALSETNGRDTAPILLELFREGGDREVLEPLARGIFRSGDREATAELLRTLESETDPARRRSVARALEEAGGSLGRDQLLAMLRDASDPEVARGLGQALERLHPEIAREAADLFARAETPSERMAFARILEERRDPQSLDLLAQALRTESDDRARWEYARLLGRRGEEGIAEVARFLREESDEGRRHSALWGLEASEPGRATEVRGLLIEIARADVSPSIRGQAAE
ncbi:MAG TPA: HEAT repeat domain-containing protein, partial [Planctomycetota bacterium]|nr:HEAT repeat domain-containing protein [Planctomycetota bacterium]